MRMLTKQFGKLVCAVTSAFAALALALSLSSLASAAESPKVSGIDYYGDASPVSVLAVRGSAGDTIFIDVDQNGLQLANRLSYTLASGEEEGVFSLGVDGKAVEGGMGIRAYSDHAGTNRLFEGRICPVYAELDGSSTQIIALRTLANGEERAFTPSETLYHDSSNYCLVRDDHGVPVSTERDGALTYSYEAFSPESSAHGSVTYVDEGGSTVFVQPIVNIPPGGFQAINVPVVVKGADGSAYRTIAYTPTLVASNPGQRDFIVKCRKLDIAESDAQGFYVATINLVDTAGNLLASDSVSVVGQYVYTAPLTVYVERDGETVAYALVGNGGQTPSAGNGGQTLVLDSAVDDVSGGSKSYSIVYEEQPAVTPTVQVTYNLIDATKSKSDPGRNIGMDIVEVSADNPTAVPPQDALLVGSEPYVLAGDKLTYEYDYKTGGTPVINAYYVPKNYTAPGSYDVTIQYVNLADNSVITTKTMRSSPDLQQDLEIETDARFVHEGSEYVRLDGQESPIEHNYYSSARTYTVYYRNVNDNLAADTVVTRIRVVYEDATTAPLDEAGDVLASDATPLALNPDGTYNAINGADGGLLTNEAGIDAESERIADAENPLAGGMEGLSPIVRYWAFGVAGLVVIVIAVALLVTSIRRKARGADEAGRG